MNVISNRQLPCDKSSMIQTVLMDSDLAWVMVRAVDKADAADAFKRCIKSGSHLPFAILADRLQRVQT